MPSQYPVFGSEVPTEEAQARMAKARARHLEVFGDDDWKPSWFLRPDDALGSDRIGGSLTPEKLAAQSEEGLQRVLAMLDELAKTVVPAWKPKIQGQTRNRRR